MLKFMGSQRVRHNLVTKQSFYCGYSIVLTVTIAQLMNKRFPLKALKTKSAMKILTKVFLFYFFNVYLFLI